MVVAKVRLGWGSVGRGVASHSREHHSIFNTVNCIQKSPGMAIFSPRYVGTRFLDPPYSTQTSWPTQV